jgi:hypothetical protein
MISPLLAKVREICELSCPPESKDGCENCVLVQGLIDAVNL